MAINVHKTITYSDNKSLCLTSTSHSYKRSKPMNVSVPPKKNKGVTSSTDVVAKNTANSVNIKSIPAHRVFRPALIVKIV